MGRHTILALALAAAGCATHPFEPPDRPETAAQATERRAHAPRPAYNLAGYPPAVREGYIDGCESARDSEFARRDAKRMAGDRQYAMGWNDGFSMCKR
jgi:hypothetical protein